MQSDRRTMDRQHRDDRRYGGDRRYEGDRRYRDDRYHKDDRHRKDYRRDDRDISSRNKKRSRSRSRSPNAKRIRRGDAASPDKPNPPAPSTLAANEKETDARRLSQRRKEITYGKNTLGYDRYTRLVPKEKRSRQDPRTPDVTGKYSKRQFDGIVKAWRRRLHEWDPPADELGPSVVPAQVAAPPPAPAVAAAAEPPAEPAPRAMDQDDDFGPDLFAAPAPDVANVAAVADVAALAPAAAPTPVADPGPPRGAAPALDDDSDDDLL